MGNYGRQENIASCHMNPSTIEILFADEKIHKEDKFYTFCFLYSHFLLTENVTFFKNPYSAFREEFEKICCRSEPCYIGPALLTMFDGKLSKPLSDQISGELVSTLCVECKLSKKDMMLSQIQQKLDIVVGRYIIDEVTAYSLVHPELYEILLHYFIKKIPESLIAFGSNDFLQTRVKLEGSTNESSNLVSVVMEKKHTEIYFDRLIEEIYLK
ncbi:unnamed protein product [Mytilus coruscus]|uniref:Uncharacterized protein n=1 Tax=Mytilus coruscus TaxID=42192 RepID=A0A6J8BPE6_MYTCO|nr:unnamed protein product [Mytilus coruscus]